MFSPSFQSVAAMAGWDEEALLIASLIVQDTPDRQFKHKKRAGFQSFKTPPTISRRKRETQRRSPALIPVAVLDFDGDKAKSKQENDKKNEEDNTTEVEKNRGDNEMNAKSNGVSSSSPTIPCIDRLREELSCAICLEICYEPSTTPCGHSFCKKCLRTAADRCGKKCPKCRQLIRNIKYCMVNIVLWNTIQLLFPQEMEARKSTDSASDGPKPQGGRSRNLRSRAFEALNSPESERRSRSLRPSGILSRGDVTRTIALPSQDEDASLALRLQRGEFMEAFREPDERRSSLAMARANLRAMASRVVNIRTRGRRN